MEVFIAGEKRKRARRKAGRIRSNITPSSILGVLSIVAIASLASHLQVAEGFASIASVAPYGRHQCSIRRSSAFYSNRISPLWALGSSKTHDDDDRDEGTDSSRPSLPHFVTATQKLATQKLADPIQTTLDEYTGWALEYADLSPESPETLIGRGFLTTNLFYLIAGILLTTQGDWTLGFFTDLAAIASFNYHYTQLQATSRKDLRNVVRFSLFLDYMAAAISILTAVVYLISTTVLAPEQLVLVEQGIAVGLAGVFFLTLSWRYEYGRPYIIYHSFWHLCSAISGYLIGSAHLQALGPL
jgi:hypothetical protein